jgi:hypothetical protein
VNRLRGGPLNEASTSIANEPKAANSAVCGWPITWSANANTAGITMAARAALFSETRPGSLMRGRGIFIRCGRPPRSGAGRRDRIPEAHPRRGPARCRFYPALGLIRRRRPRYAALQAA